VELAFRARATTLRAIDDTDSTVGSISSNRDANVLGSEYLL
jgi:hypothetical protein